MQEPHGAAGRELHRVEPAGPEVVLADRAAGLALAPDAPGAEDGDAALADAALHAVLVLPAALLGGPLDLGRVSAGQHASDVGGEIEHAHEVGRDVQAGPAGDGGEQVALAVAGVARPLAALEVDADGIDAASLAAGRAGPEPDLAAAGWPARWLEAEAREDGGDGEGGQDGLALEPGGHRRCSGGMYGNPHASMKSASSGVSSVRPVSVDSRCPSTQR